MRITFQSQPINLARRMIRLSEFSFETYPVQVSRVFRAVPVPQRPPGKWHHLCQGVSKLTGAFAAFRKNLAAHRPFRMKAPISQL